MRKSLIFIFTILIVANVFSQCADTTHIYTFQYNNKKYEVVKEMKSFPAAAICAKERGGYLVEINNKAEQTAVFNAVFKSAGIAPNYVSVSTGGGAAYVWIGATDKRTEGVWLWDGNNDALGVNFWMGEGTNGAKNGKVMLEAYNNWGGASKGKPAEPDNFGLVQNCAGMALAGWPLKTSALGIAGEWNDLICSTLLYYIVEFDK